MTIIICPDFVQIWIIKHYLPFFFSFLFCLLIGSNPDTRRDLFKVLQPSSYQIIDIEEKNIFYHIRLKKKSISLILRHRAQNQGHIIESSCPNRRDVTIKNSIHFFPGLFGTFFGNFGPNFTHVNLFDSGDDIFKRRLR